MYKDNFSDNIYKIFFQKSAFPVIITDKDYLIIDINNAAENILDTLDKKQEFLKKITINSDILFIEKEFYKICKIENDDNKTKLFSLKKENIFSENIFRALFENFVEGITIHDTNFNRIFINNTYPKIFGYEMNEFLEKPVLFNFSEEDKNFFYDKDYLKNLFVSKKYDLNCRSQHKNGKWLHINIKVLLIEDELNNYNKILSVVSDITDRIESEIKLKERENKFRILIENSLDATFIYSLQKRKYEYVSPNIEKVTSFQAENFLNKDKFLYSKVSEETKNEIESLIKNYQITNELLPIFHFDILDKNGKIRHLEQKNVAIKDGNGQTSGFHGILSDITEKRKIEKELRDSKERYRLLVEHSLDAIYFYSLQLERFEYVSPSIEKVTSYPPEYFLNKPHFLFSIISDETRKTLNKEIILLAKTNKLKPLFHYEIIDIKGEIRYLEQKNVPFYNEEGKLISYQGVISDITEKRKIQNALKESEERFRQLGTLLPQIIFETDINANIVFMNDEGMRQFQITKEDFLNGAKSFDYIDKASIERAKEVFKVRLSGVSGGIELKLKRKDGSTFYGLSYSNSAKLKGQTIIRGIIVDITQTKEIENEKNILLQKLDEHNKLKDKLFSIISHDLRDPFNSLLGLTELLIENFKELNENEKLEYIYHLHSTSKNTFDLLQNLLNWSKSQNGKIPFFVQQYSLSEKVKEIIDNFKIPLSKKNINIELNIESEFVVCADSNMLNSMISNLLGNAIKFSHKNSKIIISAERKNNEIETTFTDFGIGINESSCEKIMNSKEILSSRGTSNEKGSGLGLILVKEFTEYHKGKFSITSKIGKGTSVSFSIPVKC